MRIARYWAYGTTSAKAPDGEEHHRGLWRGSDTSEAAARAELDRALAELRRRIETRGEPLDAYEYAQGSRPEPLVEEIPGETLDRAAAVTINRYGSTVLNTARVPFVDVDAEPRRAPGAVARLLGRKRADPTAESVAALERWVAERPGRTARVYRTAAGLRYLLPATEMNPTGDESRELLARLGADTCYARLCSAQRCYRARLSPKPWRLGVGRPPGPVRYGELSAKVADWNERYQLACANHAVCEFVADLGGGEPTPDGRRVMDFHDAATRVGSGLPLA